MMNVITNNIAKYEDAQMALRNVTDPEIGLNIVDLGLIYQLDFDEAEQKIYCTMTLTTQFCPMGEYITHAAEGALKHSFPTCEIVMQLTFDPPWNYTRISAEGKQFLTE